MTKVQTIYVSLPLEAAREIRKLLLNKAAAAATAAASDPTDMEAREVVQQLYYVTSDIDEKLARKEDDE